jgi:hypothetical protein
MLPEQENKALSTKVMELTSPVGMLRVLRTQLIPPSKKVTIQVSLQNKYVNMASLKFPVPNFVGNNFKNNLELIKRINTIPGDVDTESRTAGHKLNQTLTEREYYYETVHLRLKVQNQS